MRGTQIERQRANGLLIALVGAVITIGGTAMFVRSLNVLPHWIPVVGMDSGVAICKAIAENPGQKVVSAEGDAEQIREIRGMFADSRYEDIRTSGVALMDLAAQMDSTPKDGEEFGAALMLAGPLMSALAGLSGGCAEHGYMIPTVGAK
jgi:hypothetical protein